MLILVYPKLKVAHYFYVREEGSDIYGDQNPILWYHSNIFNFVLKVLHVKYVGFYFLSNWLYEMILIFNQFDSVKVNWRNYWSSRVVLFMYFAKLIKRSRFLIDWFSYFRRFFCDSMDLWCCSIICACMYMCGWGFPMRVCVYVCICISR